MPECIKLHPVRFYVTPGITITPLKIRGNPKYDIMETTLLEGHDCNSQFLIYNHKQVFIFTINARKHQASRWAFFATTGITITPVRIKGYRK